MVSSQWSVVIDLGVAGVQFAVSYMCAQKVCAQIRGHIISEGHVTEYTHRSNPFTVLKASHFVAFLSDRVDLRVTMTWTKCKKNHVFYHELLAKLRQALKMRDSELEVNSKAVPPVMCHFGPPPPVVLGQVPSDLCLKSSLKFRKMSFHYRSAINSHSDLFHRCHQSLHERFGIQCFFYQTPRSEHKKEVWVLHYIYILLSKYSSSLKSLVWASLIHSACKVCASRLWFIRPFVLASQQSDKNLPKKEIPRRVQLCKTHS